MNPATGLVLAAERREDGGWDLLSPGVGLFSEAPGEGWLLGPGGAAGMLSVLGRVERLLLPPGVRGVVASPTPEQRRRPVGYGDLLFTLAPVERGNDDAGTAAAGPEAETGLVVCAPQAGRFWRRPEPGSPFFVQEGETLSAGRTLGLLEVMKTFNPVKYAPGGGLPEQARAARFLVEDGGEVGHGQGVLEVEPL